MKITLLYSYQNLLEKFNTSENLLNEDVLEILLTKDAINKAVSEEVKPSVSERFKIQ